MATLENDSTKRESALHHERLQNQQPASASAPQEFQDHPRRPQNFDDWSVRRRDDDPNN
jgi:hypothetical protein